MTMVIDGTNGATFPDTTVQTTTGKTGFVNRIINGAMVIDQRNAGASVSIDQSGGTYTLDRWYGRDDSPGAYSIQQVSDAPAGFTKSLKITITSTGSPSASQYGFIGTWIEGLNTFDLGWGVVGASTVTLSFWVKSSVAGQFGGTITNSAQDRTYPFSFTVNATGTWEQKSITITGDTTGTWLTTNGAGIGVNFAVGIGSNFLGTANTWAASFKMSATGQTNLYATSSATLQFTGVQLEKGSTATSFDYRPYGTELALCQRYFYTEAQVCLMQGITTGRISMNLWFPVSMRTTPTATLSTTTPYWESLPYNTVGSITGASAEGSKLSYLGGIMSVVGTFGTTPVQNYPGLFGGSQLTYSAEL